MKALLLCTGTCILTGCATSHQSGSLAQVTEYPDVLKKQSVYVDLAFSGRLNGEAWPQRDQQNQAYLEERLIRTLEESGMFSEVSDRPETADLSLLTAVINNKEKSSSGMTRSALTLFLYPYTETDTFQLMAKVTDRSTGAETVIQLSDAVKTRQQLLLGLLAPFKPSAAEGLENCAGRLLDNLVLELHETGAVK